LGWHLRTPSGANKGFAATGGLSDAGQGHAGVVIATEGEFAPLVIHRRDSKRMASNAEVIRYRLPISTLRCDTGEFPAPALSAGGMTISPCGEEYKG